MPNRNEIAKVDKEIADLKAKRLVLRKNKVWKCPNCGVRKRIKSLELQTEQYYVEPHGCTGGDYWTTGDKPIYYIACPGCKLNIRFYNERTQAWQFVNEFNQDFGSRKTVCNNKITNWKNAH